MKYQYYDSRDKIVVFRCVAETIKEANDMFEKETGARYKMIPCVIRQEINE